MLKMHIFLQKLIRNKGEMIDPSTIEHSENTENLLSFGRAIIGPVCTIVLLMLRALVGITIDPIIALPVGGIVGTIATGQAKKMMDFASTGIWIYDRFIWCDRSSGCSYDPCWMLGIRLSASWKRFMSMRMPIIH